MIEHGLIVRCDRCKRAATIESMQLNAPDYSGPKKFILTDVILQGGAVYYLCKLCQSAVGNFCKGLA
jgi:hypothetical protein